MDSWIWPFRRDWTSNCGTTGARTFATILQLSNVGFIGLVDGEGDGDVDLLVTEYEEHDDEARHSPLYTHEGPSQATLWSNDGDAAFVRSDRFTLDSEEGFWPRLWPAERLGAGGAATPVMAPIVLEVRRGWTDGGLADPAVGGQRGAAAFFSVHGQPLLLHSATGRSRRWI